MCRLTFGYGLFTLFFTGPIDNPQLVPRTKRLPQASDFTISFDSKLIRQDDEDYFSANDTQQVEIKENPRFEIRGSNANGGRRQPPDPPASVSLRNFSDVNLN